MPFPVVSDLELRDAKLMQDLYSYRNDPNVPHFDDSQPLAVMDAECAICSWGARMIHRLDHSGTVRIAPVQTPLGTALLEHYGLQASDPSSWLFLDDGAAYSDLEGVIHVGRRFGSWARFALILLILPRPVRNWLYQRFARNRYALFGRGDMCALPDPGFQKRLLR